MYVARGDAYVDGGYAVARKLEATAVGAARSHAIVLVRDVLLLGHVNEEVAQLQVAGSASRRK